MPFKPKEVAKLLVACQRCCCICHRYCGTKIETHHIKQTDPPDDAIDNAIPVCFECHAEIASYNPKHPKGRAFTPEELKAHKEQWLRFCLANPAVLNAAQRDGDVGPLQALVDELEYNKIVIQFGKQRKGTYKYYGAVFLDTELRRAIREGMTGMVEDELKTAVLNAYVAMSRANQLIASEPMQGTREASNVGGAAAEAVRDAEPLINQAHEALIRFLGLERG